MQPFTDANLRCSNCNQRFASASALLQHFARHVLAEEEEKRSKGNEKQEQGYSRLDSWQRPWRCGEIFKTKRTGHNFLENALLSINETCRKRAKLQAAAITPTTTSSENSSHSITTDKSETLSVNEFGNDNRDESGDDDEIIQQKQSFSSKTAGKNQENQNLGARCRKTAKKCESNQNLLPINKEVKENNNSCNEEETDEERFTQLKDDEIKEKYVSNMDLKQLTIELKQGPEKKPPSTTNLVLPLELRATETSISFTNDSNCDHNYDNDDNNSNCKLNDTSCISKANCDNNIVIYYKDEDDNSQDELPKIVIREGGEANDCEMVECFGKGSKRKMSNRKQTTPKKIERSGDGFVKIAPQPDDVPRAEREVHGKKGSSKKKYCCPLCSRVFGWSTDLKRHILVHTGERPFKCSNCPSSFTRKFLLQKHQTKMHPSNGKTERERQLELKVSENLKQLKTKMLELQQNKQTKGIDNGLCTLELETNGVNNAEAMMDSDNGDEKEIDIKEEYPLKTENDLNIWDSSNNNNNNNNNEEDDFKVSRACKTENIVFVEPIIIQSS